MAGTYKSFKNPGFRLAMLIFLLYLLFWLILFGFLPGVKLGAVPLITWGMSLLGVAAVCIGAAAILPLEKWEKG
jgi:hypothetical protein